MAGRSMERRLARLERAILAPRYATLEDLVLRSMGLPTRPGVVWEGPLVELILATVRTGALRGPEES